MSKNWRTRTQRVQEALAACSVAWVVGMPGSTRTRPRKRCALLKLFIYPCQGVSRCLKIEVQKIPVRRLHDFVTGVG